jgi:hypothetical protein
MKNSIRLILILFLSGVALTSCSDKVLFTRQMQQVLYKNEINMGHVQFYNSKKIVLKRNLSSEETKVASGKIRFENGKFVEEIIIPKHTPGIAVKSGKNYLNIAFERDKHKNLKFLLNYDDNYQLSAKEWDKNYGKVNYDTLTYYILPGGAKALLEVGKDNVNKFTKKKRKLKGVRIDR